MALAVIQEAHVNETGVCVDTWMIHESGATMHFEPLAMPLADRKPQAVGSAITYARRYQLAAICGLAPDDDDGQAAQDAKAPRRAAAAPTEDVSFERQHDNPFEDVQEDARPLATQAQLNKMHALGTQYYKDAWEAKRAEWVSSASGGTLASSKDLSPEQCDWIIGKLADRIAKRMEAQAQQPIATVA
jgi:hypothetical protein